MSLYLHFFLFVFRITLWHSLPQPAPQLQLPQFEQASCPVAIPSGVRVECGSLSVLEDRARIDGPRIQLPVIIIKSQTTPALPDPIVFTAGGPGFSSFGNIAGFARAPYLAQRDLILIEQRGTRYATPSLGCDELDRALLQNLTRAAPVDAEIAHEVAAADACHSRLTQNGVDVAAYHTATIAADLEDLRRVLGYDQWNLFGTSYSTRLMFTMLRTYPNHIRSVALDSPAPLMVKQYEAQWSVLDRALQQVFARCRAAAECAAAYPNLGQQLRQVIERFNREPLSIVITSPLDDQPLHARLTGNDLVLLVMGMLYDWQTIPYVPFLIDQLDRGNSAVVTPLLQTGLVTLLNYQRGMYYSVQCQDQMPFNAASVVEQERQAHPLLRNVDLPLYRSDPSICTVWPVPPAPPETHAPLSSNIPTLLVVGEYDPVVAPEWSKTAARTLDTSFVFQVPGMGHSPMIQSSCGAALLTAFLDQPTRAPEDCTATLTGLPFVTPDQIYPTSAIYQLSRTLAAQPSVLLLWLGWCILTMAGTVIVMIRVLRSWSQYNRISQVTAMLAGLAASLHLVFIVGVTTSIQRTRTTDLVMLGFGLPATTRWLLGVSLIASICTGILLVVMTWRWRTSNWAIRTQLMYSLSTITLVGYTIWLAWLDLLPIMHVRW